MVLFSDQGFPLWSAFRIKDEHCTVVGPPSSKPETFIGSAVIVIHGRSQDFSKGGSHCFIHRVLTKLSPEYCRLFAYKKAYKGGGGTGTPGPPPWLRPCNHYSESVNAIPRICKLGFEFL